MGKDKAGKFHPPKGKPSGAGKEEGLGLTKNFDPDHLEEYERITERYTSDADRLADDVPVRHPNRNTQKGEDWSGSQDTGYKSRREHLDEELAPAPPVEELPGVLNKDIFNQLASYNGRTCLTLFLPSHAVGMEVNEQVDVIAFKNLLQEAEKKLQAKGVEQTEIKTMLAPAYNILMDDQFWMNATRGLAFFISDDTFRFIRLPGSPQSEIFINSAFYVAPLVPFLYRNKYFYFLVFSKKHAKLYKADEFGMQYIPVEGMPDGVDDVVHFENKENQKLFRTGGRGGTGGANFHGIGGGKPDEKTHVALYLEEVDDTIWKNVLHNENVPLLLAGVEYLIPIYKSVTDYNNIWETAVTGNHDYDDSNRLYELAKEAMKPYFRQERDRALNEYGNKSATALTSSIIADIIPAAYYSQVQHLFARKDTHIWGKFDEQENQLTLHKERQPDSECLIDKAIIKTIQTGGDVYILDEETMPAEGELAAVLRY